MTRSELGRQVAAKEETQEVAASPAAARGTCEDAAVAETLFLESTDQKLTF